MPASRAPSLLLLGAPQRRASSTPRLAHALATAALLLAAACSTPGTEASIEEVEARPAEPGTRDSAGEPGAPAPEAGVTEGTAPGGDGAASGPSAGPPAPGGEPSTGPSTPHVGEGADLGGAPPPQEPAHGEAAPSDDAARDAGSSGGSLGEPGATGGAAAGPDASAGGAVVPPEPPGTTPPPAADAWLRTEGHRILTSAGERWRARGATVHDTRGCGACTGKPPSPEGVMRRIDVLVDEWGANLVRLALESHPRADGRTHWKGLADDAQYLADVERIVAHALSKPGVYVMLTLWKDPSLAADGWPTPATADTWRLLAARFVNEPRIIYGLSHEPTGNYAGGRNAEVWTAMNDTVQAIRDVEARLGGRRHLVAVQGTDYRAKHLDAYVARPIEAGGGENVLYEVHVRSRVAEFEKLVELPAKTLPVIIGSFGPLSPTMTESDSEALMARARRLDIPHVASTFHEGCGSEPPLITVTPRVRAGDSCGPDVSIAPTRWGALLVKGLAAPR